jgi:hypothetical protein
MKKKKRAGKQYTANAAESCVFRPRRTGFARLLTFALGVLFLITFSGFEAGAAQKKGKQDAERVPDTLILVSTFSEVGQTLRGARVRLFPADKDGNIVKGKALDGRTNNMGEFPFHVPKTEARYVVVAEMKGFARTEKAVHVVGEDQQDVFIQLPAKP